MQETNKQSQWPQNEQELSALGLLLRTRGASPAAHTQKLGNEQVSSEFPDNALPRCPQEKTYHEDAILHFLETYL